MKNEVVEFSSLENQVIEELLNKISEHDHRYVDNDLYNAFSEDGLLSAFRKFVIMHNGKVTDSNEKLAVLLRGNSKKIIIYLNNHKLWELSCTGKQVKVSFDFNHARHNKNWDKELNILTAVDGIYNFKFPKRKNVDRVSKIDSPFKITFNKNGDPIGGEIGMISCTSLTSFSMDFVEGTYKIFSKLIKDFFEPKSVDYFLEKVEKDHKYKFEQKGKGSGILLEKRWQQRLFFELKNSVNGYYAYDLEFAQPYPTKEEIIVVVGKQKYNSGEVTAKKLKEVLSANEPDMLAIRFENSEPKAIVLIEVKCTYDACKGSSGIIKHLDGMKAYADNPFFMRNRKKDAFKSIKQYQDFGFIPKKQILYKLDDLPVEKVLILTGDKTDEKNSGSIKYYLRNKEEINSHLDKCKLMFTNSNYTDDKIIWDDEV